MLKDAFCRLYIKTEDSDRRFARHDLFMRFVDMVRNNYLCT